ncbi:MAG TPA: FtsX-like permease family protein [Ktedonobacterales bacterium]
MAHPPATTTASPTIRRRRALLTASVFTLASWRLRQMWRLLLIAGLGNIAAVLLVCIVPLFTQVALGAGLHAVLADQGAGQIRVTAFGTAPTRQDTEVVQRQLDQIMTNNMGSYLTQGTPQFSVSLPLLPLTTGDTSSAGQGNTPLGEIQVFGADIAQAAQHYTLVDGRLPLASSRDLEIALAQSDASQLKVRVGSILHAMIPGPSQAQSPTLDLHLVGIFMPPPDFGRFEGQQFIGGPRFGSGRVDVGPRGPNFYVALASNDTLFNVIASSGSSSQDKQGGPPPTLSWTYQLNVSRVTTSTLNDLLDRLGRVQTDVPGQLSGSQGLQGVFLDSGAYQALGNFRTETIVLQIPLLLILLQVIALVLLFVNMMAEVLVEHEAESIAVLRSRGATRRQIFNSFTLHNIGLSLIALIVGPLAAIPLVRFLSLRSLPAQSQNAVDALSGNPLAVAYGLRWYVLVAVVAAGFAMIFSTNRAASKNVLALRRENARSTTKPFWQRLNLDLIFGGLSLLGYAGYSLAIRQVSPRIQLILSPLSLIAALVMLVAAALLFLRLLPILLTIGSRLSTRGRGAASMLALTQMARAPRQPIRMTLLLALSTGFTLFTLIYSGSQAQRLVDAAAFQVGADFSGTIPVSATKNVTVADLTAKYRQIPGVTSATVGYTADLTPNNDAAGLPVRLFAVDSDTYAQSASWTDQDSTQPLSTLMAQLRAARATAASTDSVPAVLDDATWQAFHLSPGAQFTMQPPGYDSQSMRFVAVARIHYLPTVYDSFQGGGFSGANGGVLVDYQSYAAVYAHDLTTSAGPAANMAWIATRDDAASVASVRKALGTGELALDNLQDRRQITDAARDNPLQIDMANTLLIGAATALLLALIAIWVGSWLNARRRLVNFAVLRALGTTPAQLRAMLVWEQVIVYIAGLALGLVLGWVLSLTALPLLLFVDLVTGGNFTNTPNVPPARVILPGGTLALALGVLVGICLLALVLTMTALARLSLGQTLRLNED